MPAGESYTQNANLFLPEGIAGDFYVLLFTDANVSGPLPPRGPGVNLERSLFAPDPPVSSVQARIQEFRDEGNNIT
ncbi:MAG: hypothetical protein GTO03_10135, partial [Planctomycetales bacterium]|nr:hypothetical protein [Planctomycetales bacterium]